MKASLFQKIERDKWRQLRQKNKPLPLIPQLAELVSLNDRLSQVDIQEVYGPLIDYIDLLYSQEMEKLETQEEFLQTGRPRPPFIIGISGSVAVGKSTITRVLHQLLAFHYPNKKISYMTTDGFLYPNKELERRNLMRRKGFPESYDMARLLNFMKSIKLNEEQVTYPVYSHYTYDIVADQYEVMVSPDILIVEGINVLQLPQNQEIYVSDFFDLSLYVDAHPDLIRQWYLERFDLHMDLAKDDPKSYYHALSQKPRDEAHDYARKIWREVNLVNLFEHILPTRERADVIIHKTDRHYIDAVSIRKY